MLRMASWRRNLEKLFKPRIEDIDPEAEFREQVKEIAKIEILNALHSDVFVLDHKTKKPKAQPSIGRFSLKQVTLNRRKTNNGYAYALKVVVDDI